MSPSTSGPELTLIVAATQHMGIGRAGTLPWTGLRKEMAYFARVTKRLPSHPPSAAPTAQNAVIMGRKTWESIPERFRPLPGRVSRVFVIGGGQIYAAALRLKEARRVLLTRVRSEFECDTFFPLRLEEGKEGTRWRRAGQEEMDKWVGEEVPRGAERGGDGVRV
ncbi:hypothetical protein N0V88_005941 [Collariella sp. IMI 366227]|nr:hypothetical protein N0V88_005941 [Collariella sp. IMI 366227]